MKSLKIALLLSLQIIVHTYSLPKPPGKGFSFRGIRRQQKNGCASPSRSGKSSSSRSRRSSTANAKEEHSIKVPLPYFGKTESEEKFLLSQIEGNFLFQHVKDFAEVISAFEKVSFPSGSIICKQGDSNTDYLYVIDSGECNVSIDDKQLPEPYGTMTKGGSFGELGMLFGSSRAATVVAATGGITAYRLDKRSFNYFMRTNEGFHVKEEVIEIDRVIDEISGVKTRYKGDIIRPYKPARLWLWTRWTGTILQQAWKASAFNMVVSILFITLIRKEVNPTWIVGGIPDPANPMIERFVGLGKLWHYIMTLTTFILTFFLDKAYTLWRDMYSLSRKIQGRMNDIGLLLATTAERDAKGKYTQKADELLDDVALCTRLFHVFMWANYAERFKILLTPRGMSRMFSRGVMTRKQYDILSNLRYNEKPHEACMMWMKTRCLKGIREGALSDSSSVSDGLFGTINELRGTQASIGDAVAGRIPLAYTHFVQILVDTFLALAPFVLYSELGVWSVPAVGILTLFYSGLLDLAKILLDPLNNDKYYQESVNMDIGVLIREGNAGSTRWKSCLESSPF